MRRLKLIGGVGQLDLILNLLVAITAAFVLAFLYMNPPEQKKQENVVPTDGKYIVMATWPDGSKQDVDLYVQDPAGNTAYFKSRDVGLMHYEHDDLGERSDTMMSSSGQVRVEKNEERVILRGTVAGEYTVNVHFYSQIEPGGVPVTVTLYQLQGQDSEVIVKERVLTHEGEEQTAFRFITDSDGNIIDINELPKRLIGAGPQMPTFRGFTP